MPPDKRDKRAVVPLALIDWDMWLNGSLEDALSLIQLPALHLFQHGASDPAKNLLLPIHA